MISQMPTKIALLVAATMFMTGCATKPKQASRFHHSATAGGSCACYTCQNYVNDTSSVTTYTPVTTQETMAAPMVYTPTTPAPISVQARPLYKLPTTTSPAPIVSSDSFESLDSESPSLVDIDQPVINEVQPDSGLKLNTFTDPKIESGGLDGGSFKPLQTEKKVVETIPEINAPKTVEIPKPVETAIVKPKIVEPTPVASTSAIPTPAVTPSPVEPTPIVSTVKKIVEPIEIPKSASTFKPGEAFKPRKKITPLDSSSWKSPEALLNPLTEEKVEVAVAPAPVAVPAPAQDPIDSFFGREDFETAKPLRQAQGGKIVLRANPVERNVVYVPPSKSVSQVVVPALRASFKKTEDGNWLREPPTEQDLVQATQVAAGNTYEKTTSANIAQLAPQPQPQPAPIQTPVQPVQIVEAPEIKKIPVRLRAIPMNEQMIKGKQVDVRFREHVPAPQQAPASENIQRKAEASTPQRLISRSTDIPALPVNELTPPQPNEVNLELATPAMVNPAWEHTARAVEDDVATPPWRIK